MKVEVILSLMSIFVTAFGLIFVAKQISDGRRFMKAEFINELEESLSNLYDTYFFLLSCSTVGNNPVPQSLKSDEIKGVLMYLGFFEKIKLLLDNKTVDIYTVDRMFAFRFFLIANHPLVQNSILYNKDYSGFFNAIFALHEEWTQYREKHNLEIPFDKTDLKDVEHLQYNRNVLEFLNKDLNDKTS